MFGRLTALLNSGLITRRVTRIDPQSVTGYYSANREYAVNVNEFVFQESKASLCLRNASGELLSATEVKCFSKSVRVRFKGTAFIYLSGIRRLALIRCAAKVGGVWVYFDVRFM